jgi:hypothetical protein
VHYRGIVGRPGPPLPLGGTDDFLPKRGMTAGTGLQYVGRRWQQGSSILCSSRHTDGVGAAVEVERHLAVE